MLTAIEGFYLNVLRVVILAAATLALVAAIFGLVKVGPLIAASIPGHSAIGTAQPGLGDWVALQKSSGAAPTGVPDSDNTAQTVSADMQSALDRLANYNSTRMGGTLDMASARTAFLSNRDGVTADYQTDYDRSLNALMGQVEQSKGTPLDVDNFNSLIHWHVQQFNAAVAAKEATKDQDRANGLVGLGLAGAAMVSFFLLVFCFLFVKIERNLRLIHVAQQPL